MNKNSSDILLVGDLQKGGSRSTQIYLDYLKENLNNVDYISPNNHLKYFFYKNFVYPFVLPKNYKIYHILGHSYGYLAHFLYNKRTIITCHDLIPLKFPGKLSSRARIFFKYYISGQKKSDKIIAVSENTKNDLMELLDTPEEKIKVIPPISIDRKKYEKLSKSFNKSKYKVSNNFVLMSIGGMFYKNTLLILKALKDLVKDYPDVILLKVGGFLEEENSFIKKNNLKNFIVRKSEVSEAQLIELYNLSDIFVFPSLYEGFGIPPLEAMSCGVPVITSNTSSLPEVVGDAAIKIDPYSKNQLTRAIHDIRNNSQLREKLINKGYLNLQRFKSEKIIKKIECLYKEII